MRIKKFKGFFSEGKKDFLHNAKKGVSPVIATILMVMITVGLVAFSYTWFINMGESAKKATETSLGTITSAQQQRVSFDVQPYQEGGDVKFIMYGAGTESVNLSKVKTYENDRVPVGWNGVAIGSISACSATGNLASGDRCGAKVTWTCSPGDGLTLVSPAGRTTRTISGCSS